MEDPNKIVENLLNKDTLLIGLETVMDPLIAIERKAYITFSENGKQPEIGADMAASLMSDMIGALVTLIASKGGSKDAEETDDR